jgi:hypothetical protein
MRAFHAKLNAIKRDEIAARHIRLGNPTLASYVSRQQRRGSVVMDANYAATSPMFSLSFVSAS